MLKPLKYYWPVVLLVTAFVIISLYLRTLEDPNCTIVLGYSASLWALALFCFGMPLLAIVSSLYLCYAGWHSLEQGVYPPANVPALGMRVRSGRVAKLQGLVALFFPIITVLLALLGAYVFGNILGDHDLQSVQEKLLNTCSDK